MKHIENIDNYIPLSNEELENVIKYIDKEADSLDKLKLNLEM